MPSKYTDQNDRGEDEEDEENSPLPPPYPGKPPFDLVQLHTLPINLWKGRPVFHPLYQVGDVAYWRAEDDPYFDPSSSYDANGELIPGDEPGTEYDVGVVVKWETENWRRESNNPGAHEVYFLTGNGGTLHYAAFNLWTPRLPHELELLALLAPSQETP